MSHGSRTALILMGTVIVLLIGAIAFQLVINSDLKEQTYTVRLSQYRACVLNGNDLRDDVRDEFVDLKRVAIIRVYKDFIAQVPEGAHLPPRQQESLNILTSTVDRLHRRIRTIDQRIPDVDCLKVYPPLPGQVYPDRSEL